MIFSRLSHGPATAAVDFVYGSRNISSRKPCHSSNNKEASGGKQNGCQFCTWYQVRYIITSATDAAPCTKWRYLTVIFIFGVLACHATSGRTTPVAMAARFRNNGTYHGSTKLVQVRPTAKPTAPSRPPINGKTRGRFDLLLSVADPTTTAIVGGVCM